MSVLSNPARAERVWLLAIILLALSLRGAVLIRQQADLADDRDAYLALAEGLLDGRGYSVPGSREPTAFRPPLYPLLIAGATALFGRNGVPALHLLASALTALLIWATGRRLQLPPTARLFAALLFAVDPLSLRYIAFPMTETVCALLAAFLLFCLSTPPTSAVGPLRTLASSLLTGAAFGALVLCRPTFWLFGLAAFCLFACGLMAKAIAARQTVSDRDAERRPARKRTLALGALGLGVGACLFVAPWTLRNLRSMGSPIVMTTHGGYTRLLGNNEAFYREVVDQPWGTIWDGSRGPGQAAWHAEIDRRMEAAGVQGEVARDRWMTGEANRVIEENPATFLRAAFLKFLWFWSVVPHAASHGALPVWLLAGVGLFYTLFWVAVLAGTAALWRSGRCRTLRGWGSVVLLTASLSAAHLLYWSDARMRAPIVPALALLAAAWRLPASAGRNEGRQPPADDGALPASRQKPPESLA